jgi:hypothetical protein
VEGIKGDNELAFQDTVGFHQQQVHSEDNEILFFTHNQDMMSHFNGHSGYYSREYTGESG